MQTVRAVNSSSPFAATSDVRKDNVLWLDSWSTHASAYQEEQAGNFCIGRHVYKPGIYNYPGMDGHKFFVATSPLTITTLREYHHNCWNTWMVDTPSDFRAMQKYAARASGNVLTTGLGLGLVAHELCLNDAVEGVTVVERSPEVIALVAKYLPQDGRIKVVCDDFWRFVMLDDTAWDSIIVDHWVFHRVDEQAAIYLNEVIPFNKSLSRKYPKANIVFHAFAGMPDPAEVKRSPLGKDLGMLIWGLTD